jgi:hypothetical protein
MKTSSSPFVFMFLLKCAGLDARRWRAGLLQ